MFYAKGDILKLRILLLISAVFLSACQSTSSAPEKKNLSQEQILEQRSVILGKADKALARLYAENPEVRKEIEEAVGYGVFDVTTVNALVLVGAKGPGVIFDNKTKSPTFMVSLRAGTGPGVGYQELLQVFVFKSAEALAQFKVANKGGGDLIGSVTVGTNAQQLSINPYINLYQLSEKGFAVQANYGGAVYYVDPDLN
jgi:lipid-binding SYLF domain-containing protein